MHHYAVLASMKTSKNSGRHREALGLAVRRRREGMDLSQEKLAEIVDCHRNYVGLVERGEQNVTIGMLGRIAKALECTVTDLVRDARL
jgi:transcriptional regulator with XRE-family HTH domain